LASVVDAVRRADEGDDYIAIGGFIQDDFGMAGGNDLRSMARGYIGQQLINLALAKNLKMCVRFVQEKHRLRVGVEVSQQQECLLQATTG
jgi:hypothetical protein